MKNKFILPNNGLLDYSTIHKILSYTHLLKDLSNSQIEVLLKMRETVLERPTTYKDTYNTKDRSCNTLKKAMGIIQSKNLNDFNKFLEDSKELFTLESLKQKRNYKLANNKEELEDEFKYIQDYLIGKILYNPDAETFVIITSYGLSRKSSGKSYINLSSIAFKSSQNEVRKTTYSSKSLFILDNYIQYKFKVGLGLYFHQIVIKEG